MTWLYFYRDNDGNVVEFTSRVQHGFAEHPGTTGLVQNAEEGSMGISQVRVEDPDGDWDINGHRLVYVGETECAGDDYGGVIWSGYSASRRIERDVMRTGDARIWTVSLVDLNTVFDRRIMEGSDANRPAETDVERIQWAEATNEGSLIDDTLYLSTDDPVNMDAVDYRGQTFRAIFDDCAQQSGKNWFLWRRLNEWSLWYGPRGTSDFVSDIRISNVRADVDSTVTFAPSIDTYLTRDPSRVYSGVHLAYASSHLYVQRESTAVAFARRDAFSPAPNVKSKTKAKLRANRYLTDVSTEEDVISTAIIVRRAQSNDVVAGQRIQAKFSHLPGYEDYVWCRVLNRTMRELSPEFIEIAMELSPDEAVESAGSGNVFGTLQRCIAYDVLPYCYFSRVGDNPQAGDPIRPTVGLITAIQDTDNPYAPTWTYNGWLIGGDGTVDVTFYTSTIGITPTSVTFAITLNGVAVASVTQANTGNGNDGTVSITGLAVTSGDIIRATCVSTPQGVPFFRSPRGTGDAAEALTITGGTLV